MPKRSKRIKKSDKEKPWAKRKLSLNPYQVESRSKAKSFLIVCEGENTEPEYFKSFPVGNAEVQSFGLGHSKTSLVEHVIEITKLDETAKDKEIWVVFDMDLEGDQEGVQKEDFNNAIDLARNNGFQVAYSNDAFELWFVLHYQYLDSEWLRHQYYDRLSEIWGCNYQKDGKKRKFCRKIYRRLQEEDHSDEEKAVHRAKKLLDEMIDRPYADRNPCTTVFQLVEELNQYL